MTTNECKCCFLQSLSAYPPRVVHDTAVLCGSVRNCMGVVTVCNDRISATVRASLFKTVPFIYLTRT